MNEPGFKTLGTKVNYLLANGFSPEDFAEMSAAEVAAALEIADEELRKIQPQTEGGDQASSRIRWDMSDAVIPDTTSTEVKDLSSGPEFNAFADKYMDAFTDNSNMESAFEFIKWAINAFIIAAV